MKQIRFTEAVAEDLEEIYTYIANDSFAAADKVILRLQKSWRLLAENPGLGRKRDDLQLNLKSFAQDNYIIFYCEINIGIELIRVLHASRDIEHIFHN